jgi:hypothetical protein
LDPFQDPGPDQIPDPFQDTFRILLTDTVSVIGALSNSETIADPVRDLVSDRDLDTVPDPVIATDTKTSSFPLKF